MISILSSIYKQYFSTTKIEINGVEKRFDTNLRAEGTYRYFEKAENELLSALLDATQPDDVFFDVGSNFGLYPVFLADAIPRGELTCFEPYPPNQEHLRQHLDLHNISNAQIVEKVVADSVGQVVFEPPEERNCGTAGIVDGNEDENFEVEATTIDTYVEENNQSPDIIKIDVEGAEKLVFQGMRETLESGTCRVIGCELHPDGMDEFNSDIDSIRELLSEYGYDIEEFDRDGQTHLIARLE